VSIPISQKKLRQRGYNQSQLLIKAVSEILEMPLTDVIMRGEGHLSQVQTGDKKSRKLNIKGVFSVVKSAEVPSKIILVDDVVTTGATVEEATRVLKKFGAKEVIVLAVALA
jgi:ComF family protein